MPLLIDGYNLLYGSGIVGDTRGARGFERSRMALIGFVIAAVDERERGGTTIVFDAAGAPPGLPSTLLYEGVTVRFARGYADADALLEELIAADHAPRKLTVVSSDHRVQRAAKRRRAAVLDSDVWYADALRRRRDGPGQAAALDIAKPQSGGESDVRFWLDRIDGDKEIAKGFQQWDEFIAPKPIAPIKQPDKGKQKPKKHRRWS